MGTLIVIVSIQKKEGNTTQGSPAFFDRQQIYSYALEAFEFEKKNVRGLLGNDHVNATRVVSPVSYLDILLAPWWHPKQRPE